MVAECFLSVYTALGSRPGITTPTPTIYKPPEMNNQGNRNIGSNLSLDGY